jgi:hypothetical protein
MGLAHLSGVRLDVNKNIFDPIDIALDGDTDSGGDVVGRAYSEFRIDFEMQVDVIAQAGFAGETLFDAERAGDAHGDRADFVHLFAFGHGVHQLQCGFSDHAQAEEDDEKAHGEAAPMVGGSHFWKMYGERNGDECDQAGAHIDRVVQSIGGERDTAGFLADPHFRGPQAALQNSGAEQRPEREGSRRVLIVTFRQGTPGNSSAGDSEDGSDGEAGQDFETAVAIGVVGIGRLGGDPETEQDQAGHQDVGSGFESVGDQGDRVGSKADENFYRGESGADADADHRGAAGGLFQTSHASGYEILDPKYLESPHTQVTAKLTSGDGDDKFNFDDWGVGAA